MSGIWDYLFFSGVLIVLILIIYFGIKKSIKRKKRERKNNTKNFKCLDGHIVRSKGELIIDNYLYILDIKHEYEKKIKLLNYKVKCDWYLPEFDVYLEYWGFHGKNYLKRKKEKIKLYKKLKLKLISIENYMFSDIYFNLNKKLKPFTNIKKIEPLIGIKKHCFNCGAVLDERF
ncbi:MAG: hypothetical protein ACFE8E_02765 [Candidatus Hodarchaeota archaeon]